MVPRSASGYALGLRLILLPAPEIADPGIMPAWGVGVSGCSEYDSDSCGLWVHSSMGLGSVVLTVSKRFDVVLWAVGGVAGAGDFTLVRTTESEGAWAGDALGIISRACSSVKSRSSTISWRSDDKACWCSGIVYSDCGGSVCICVCIYIYMYVLACVLVSVHM